MFSKDVFDILSNVYFKWIEIVQTNHNCIKCNKQTKKQVRKLSDGFGAIKLYFKLGTFF